tara:strand:+ start:971 stop:2098 length:1128 start_codon:yes stop_codon:yes gene_type:complete
MSDLNQSFSEEKDLGSNPLKDLSSEPNEAVSSIEANKATANNDLKEINQNDVFKIGFEESRSEEEKDKNKLSKKQPESKIEDDLNELNKNKILTIFLQEIESKKNILEKEIELLNQKKSKLDEEIKSSFTGQSDAIARKVKGFQEYLTGSLQELAKATEQMQLIEQPLLVKASPLDEKQKQTQQEIQQTIPAISDTFSPDKDLIQESLVSFQEQPDFYAEPWKLRRSLDKKDIELLEDWFLNMGGRGAQPSRGNRSKNVLVAAGLISILGELYGDRFQTLVLASQPERLGEWRRGLQDALGLSREDFGPNSGIVLFERAEGVVDRADRLEERGEVPFIIVDAAEQVIDIQVLQFPLWLAFAADPDEIYEEEELLL